VIQTIEAEQLQELLIIKDKPLIHYSINECFSAGVENIAIVINKDKENIKDYLENAFKNTVNFKFFYQNEPNSLVDAIILTENFVGKDPFFILMPDIIFQKNQNPLDQLKKCYSKYGALCTALIPTEGPDYQIGSTYGFIKYEDINENFVKITKLFDKGSKQRSKYKTIGRGIWDYKLLNYLLNNRFEDALGEYSEVPAMQKYIEENEFYGVKLSTIGYDCGTLDGFKFATKHFEDSKNNTSINKKINLSVIIPVYNEEENIPELYRRVTTVLEKISNNEGYSSDSYEIIMVNDGSTDGSWQLIKETHKKDSRLKGISFSRNFGHHAAMAAGLEQASGEINIIMDADLQAQPEDIPKAIAKIREGYNIVWAVSEKREDSFIVKVGAKIFYFLMNKIASIKIPKNIVFICFSRLAADAMKSYKEKRCLPSGIWSDIGFMRGTVVVEKKERLFGKPKYNFIKRLRILLMGAISYSKIPLRFVTILGFIMSFVSFMIGMRMLMVKLLFDAPVSGYTSIIVSVTMLSGVQLIALGLIAEYLGIVFDEVKNRPIYIISEKL
jgi:dolichol-phosphate mannosyltransferase